LELIVLETIRHKLGGEEALSFLPSSPLWSGGWAYRLYFCSLASWVVILINILSGVFVALIVCSFVFIFVEPLGGS
jgi:hypothetical protein